MKQNHYRRMLGILSVISIFLIVICITIGFYPLPIKETVVALLKPIFGDMVPPLTSKTATIVYNIRLPRVLGAFLIGVSLSISGCAYQGMFKNPLVSPDILGVSAGAGFGAALAISVGLPYYLVQVCAFIGGIVTVMLGYTFSHKIRFNSTVSLVLIGSMLSTLCTSMTTLLKYLADTNDTLPAITFWLMGSLSKVTASGVYFTLLPTFIGIVVLFMMRWRLNVLTLGDDEARSIGINPNRTRFIVIIAATLLSASAVCLGGLIGWVGLMIPHMARRIAGNEYRRLLPVTALVGGSFLLVMDTLARSISSMEIPIGVLTAFIGAPFFLLLIARQNISH
ncbi:MAG: FecCD family ABC transporter permease [Cellulosilyticaceae bacterium]